MLVKVIIKNYLSIKEEQEIKLNNTVTSIIGKNESGKSTILKAINKLNGEKITKQEKNVNLKNEYSHIIGIFKLEKKDIKKINEAYSMERKYPINLLPCDYENLYYSIKVDDSDSISYQLYRMNEKNVLVNINMEITQGINFRNNALKILESLPKNDEIDMLKKELKKLNKDEISKKLRGLDVEEEYSDDINSLCDEIEKNSWHDILPKYKFIKFSSFSDVLNDNISFDSIENNLQAKNILKIAGIDIDELGDAFERTDERLLEDLQTQYIDVVSKKFKEIFQQTDENFKLKIRFGTSNRELIFLTLDKTSGTSSIELSQRSDGFKWYLSLYLSLYEYLNKSIKDVNYVLLLDEPNLYLHPGAQNNLLKNVFYDAFSDVQIVYTTHSPYMIDTNNNFCLRIAEKENQTLIYNSVQEYATKNKKIKDVDTITPLLTALDLNVSNSIIFDEKNIIVTVEGIQDVYLLKAMIKKLDYELEFENIRFISCMSAEKIPYMFAYLYGMGYEVYALVDNDSSGKKAINSIKKNNDIEDIEKRLLTYDIDGNNSEKFLLENLLSDNDKAKYLPQKNTIYYKLIYDEIDKNEFDEETIENFSKIFKKLLNLVKKIKKDAK